MAAFFSEVLDKVLSPVFLRKVREKYHFTEVQAEELRTVAKEMLPYMREEAFWESGDFQAENNRGARCVVMSLGMGVDCLQENYSRTGMLLRAYMIDALAGEIFFEAYKAYHRFVEKNTGFHIVRYHFWGSEEAFPLEMLPRLLSSLDSQVTCNAAFCMTPKKSVAFVAEMTSDENVQCMGICGGCSRKKCEHRQ